MAIILLCVVVYFVASALVVRWASPLSLWHDVFFMPLVIVWVSVQAIPTLLGILWDRIAGHDGVSQRSNSVLNRWG